MKIKKDSLAYIAALFYVLITGHSFLFNKIALETGDPLDILAHRFSAAFFGGLTAVALGWVKVSFKKDGFLKILPLATLYPLAFFGFQTVGLLFATSSEAGIISASAPIFTLILASVFLKERSGPKQRWSIIISVAGVVYVAVMKGASPEGGNLPGLIILTLSALSIAGYNVLAKSLTRSFTNTELISAMITISFIFYNGAALLRHGAQGSITDYFIPLRSGSYSISILYLGVLSSLFTSWLTNFMLYKLPASRVGVFINLTTVVAILAGVLILKEEFYYYHVIGSALIIGGVIGANYFKPPVN